MTFCTSVSNKSVMTHGNDTTGSQLEDLNGRDASWILTSAVIIFTMQTGWCGRGDAVVGTRLWGLGCGDTVVGTR